MFRTIKTVAAFILATWVIAGICALIDVVYNLLTGGYLTETVTGLVSYFSQNVIVNFTFIGIFVLLGFFAFSAIILIFKKSSYRADRIMTSVFAVVTTTLFFFIASLIVNEFYLPYVFAPISIFVNSLISLAALASAIIIGYFSKRFIPIYQRKPIIIGAIIFSGIVLGVTAVGSIKLDRDNQITEDELIAGPNIVIITIDALRQDRVSAYGEYSGITPNIDAFGEEAVRFNTACAPAPWTIPSMYSMLCSRYPSVHGAELFEMGHPDIPMMAEILRKKGYETEAYVANASLYGEFGFNRGYDNYVEYGDFTLIQGLNKASVIRAVKKLNNHVFPYFGLNPDDSTTWLTKEVIKTLEEERERPLFLWAHYLDPHTPLSPPREYINLNDEEAEKALAYAKLKSTRFLSLDEAHKDELRALYEAEVRYVDDKIGDIVSVLEEEGYFDNSIIIITSDHGEAFFEHGHYGHGLTHYKEEIDIPLFIYLPEAGPQISDYPAGLIDIAPTILDYIGIPVDRDMSGESLLPAINEGVLDKGKLIFVDRTESDNNVISVHDARYTLMRRGEKEYTYTMIDNSIEKGPYDIIEEPDPETYRRFKTVLDERINNNIVEKEALGSSDTKVELDEERRDTIKGLGYL